MKQICKILIACGLAILAVFFIGWWQVDGPGAASVLGKRSQPLTEMDFELTNQNGEAVGPKTLIGQPSLVFFGFTYCPDVCPTTLSDISAWLDEIGPDAEALNTILISVDPDRDTVEVMAEYVSYFHPQIQGWTGSDVQVASAAAGFRAVYEKVMREDGDYTMNHTAGVFLFDATGRFVTTIDYHEPREFAVPKIRRAMQSQDERAET
ncbi:SCO family protein [Sulfitobacter geojensis]|uniref:SCO family protein n=1 Tax=Sulfitobacter geojensis TaxID=1342299 RepID=A0AAE2W260_9RHOB|nr:SCO family protein [Sulfitobacter geojensis]MBM1691398.1 SCO family protein [Sulfitobacter geojensis]MBM1695464.1 SCO family protein [Sulfitobacter geojensis]MBM1707652.1 SCO family protein [Sulfitobacter geojensis]MBM1711714.1 SCO family protein [Sulfitobacter geojensis]MBM1715777.1 SCO family protein [Sulfitobacter geojensis]